MFYLRNRTIEDIAHRLSINPNAVKQRLHRARGRALKQFRQAGYEDFQKLSEAFYVE
jgi:DNA-directed RNA polymerase specialized sigma24 family protein